MAVVAGYYNTAASSYKNIKDIFVANSEKLISETIDTKTTQKACGTSCNAGSLEP